MYGNIISHIPFPLGDPMEYTDIKETIFQEIGRYSYDDFTSSASHLSLPLSPFGAPCNFTCNVGMMES